MTVSTEDKPVVVVTGPTAAGKTAISIEIALRFGGEIVNADSMQVYRYMDIGTAKPSLEERGRVPHHLFDVVTPDCQYSAGRYAEEARAVAADIHARGKLVVLTGGTGLYIRAFLEGLAEVGPANPELRKRMEDDHARALAEGDPTRLHRRLAEIDPEAAGRIHPNDLVRTMRALEIAEVSGQTLTTHHRAHSGDAGHFRSLHLAIDPGRDLVRERIDRRCEAMIETGLLQEVRQLRNRGYGPELRPMQAIGYRHINPVVDGRDTLANALTELQRDTRRFARRQRVWLRAVEDVHWMDPGQPDAIDQAVEKFLGKPPPAQTQDAE
jgi:tRNA dimethylallyltransferase